MVQVYPEQHGAHIAWTQHFPDCSGSSCCCWVECPATWGPQISDLGWDARSRTTMGKGKNNRGSPWLWGVKKREPTILCSHAQAPQCILELPFQKLNRSLCLEISSDVPIRSQLKASPACSSLRSPIVHGPRPIVLHHGFCFLFFVLSYWRMMPNNNTTQKHECDWKD